MKIEETSRVKHEDTETQTKTEFIKEESGNIRIEEVFSLKHEDTEEPRNTSFIKDESEDMKIEETFRVKHEDTEEQTELNRTLDSQFASKNNQKRTTGRTQKRYSREEYDQDKGGMKGVDDLDFIGAGAIKKPNYATKNNRRKILNANKVSSPDITQRERPGRIQKSLGLLCRNFLELYPENKTPKSINIPQASKHLGAKKQRLCEIVSVLESLKLVRKTSKNLYVWIGRSVLPETLQNLRQKGQELGYHFQMDQKGGSSPYAHNHMQNMHTSNRRKDKSLCFMSEKFVMLFLMSNTQTVTLNTAAKILSEEGQDESNHRKYKTKERRLYDIANVLTSLNLIEKFHKQEENRSKLSFKWIGHSSIDEPAGRRLQFGDSAQPSLVVSSAGLAPLPLASPVPGHSEQHLKKEEIPEEEDDEQAAE